MRLNKLILFFLLTGLTAIGQDINTTEIIVVEDFKPSIPKASRLNINAVFADTIKRILDKKSISENFIC